MSAYIIADVTVTNEAQMKQYREWSTRAMQAFDAEVLVRGGRVVPERPPDGRQPRPVPLTRLTMALWQEPKPPQGVAGATASK